MFLIGFEDVAINCVKRFLLLIFLSVKFKINFILKRNQFTKRSYLHAVQLWTEAKDFTAPPEWLLGRAVA